MIGKLEIQRRKVYLYVSFQVSSFHVHFYVNGTILYILF